MDGGQGRLTEVVCLGRLQPLGLGHDDHQRGLVVGQDDHLEEAPLVHDILEGRGQDGEGWRFGVLPTVA